MPSFKNIFKVVGAEQAAPTDVPSGGDIAARIRGDIENNQIVLYMKGNPDNPQCGFSAATVEALNTLAVEYAHRDVLQDPELRQGIKEFSNWPTVPQVYVKGKFIGGCDIVLEMQQSGELEKIVKG